MTKKVADKEGGNKRYNTVKMLSLIFSRKRYRGSCPVRFLPWLVFSVHEHVNQIKIVKKP